MEAVLSTWPRISIEDLLSTIFLKSRWYYQYNSEVPKPFISQEASVVIGMAIHSRFQFIDALQ